MLSRNVHVHLRGICAPRRCRRSARHVALAQHAHLRDVISAVLGRADGAGSSAIDDDDTVKIRGAQALAVGDSDARAGHRRHAQIVEGDAVYQS